jgi:hypothetical protein
MQILLPKNINLDEFKEAASKAINDFRCSNLFKILNLIQTVNIYSQYSKYPPGIHNSKFSAITFNYRKYIMFLKDQGIIGISNHYIVGKQSKCYILTHLDTSGLDVLTIKKRNTYIYINDLIHTNYNNSSNNTDLTNNELNSSKDFCSTELIKSHPISTSTFDKLYYDYSFLDRIDNYIAFLDFDSKVAAEINDKQLIENLKNPQKKSIKCWEHTERGWRLVDKTIESKPKISHVIKQLQISRWKENDHFDSSVDTTSYRFHNPITTLPKFFRPCLSSGKEKLVALDLKSSQPFMSTLLLSPEFWYCPSLTEANKSAYHKIIGTPIEYAKINLDTIGMAKHFSNPTIYSYILKKLMDVNDDFQKQCLSGNLYEYMMDQEKISTGLDVSRNYMKKAILMAMYSSNRTKNDSKISFNRLFPKSNSFFELIKKRKYKHRIIYGSKDIKANAILAIMLQRIESFLFLNIISRKIIDERPDVLMIPLHDSIVTTESNVEYVKGVIQQTIKEITGHTANLNEEVWE